MPPRWIKEAYEAWLFPEMRKKLLVNRQQAACVIGGFFEQFTMSLMGGVRDECPDDWDTAWPDIVYWGGWHNEVDDLVLEVKAGGRMYSLYVSYQQCKRYAQLEQDEFPFTNAHVWYLFFVHGVKGSGSRFKYEEDLITALSQNIQGAVLVPLSMVRFLMDVRPIRGCDGWSTPGHPGGGGDLIADIRPPQMVRIACGDVDPLELWGGWALDYDEPFDREEWGVWRARVPPCRLHGLVTNSFWMCMVYRKEDFM